jgi:hypothetical protein
MTSAPSLSKDALRLYALTMAYLYDEEIGNEGSTSAVQVQEISSDLFHIWQGEPPAGPKQSITPVAVCTYNQATLTWKVKLSSGESLTLLDKQNVWEVVGETKKKSARKDAKKSVRKDVKKKRRGQSRKLL